GVPFAFELAFEPGRVSYPFVVKLNNKKVVQQAEGLEYYRDGSIRKVSIVLYPEIAAGDLVLGHIGSCIEKANTADVRYDKNVLQTPSVLVEFNPNKGLAIKSLTFPGVSSKPLAGTISHEFYDEVDLSTDQYTGHVIINERQFNKVTDLAKAEIILPEDLAACTVRVPVRAKISLPVGELWKTVFVYIHEPRIDITYHFRLKDVSPQSFRLGMLTLNPLAFNPDSLAYVTVNGGSDCEYFHLADRNIAQDSSIDTRFTTSHCLGATEGWISLGDDKNSLGVITGKDLSYSVPLLNYRRTKESFFLRVYNSIGEKDETSNHFWRGHLKHTVSFYGHRNDLARIRKVSRMINKGIILVQL
ncbi:MAG: hypothetical protein ACYC21_16010, partial [Eubacteriales bacterium]